MNTTPRLYVGTYAKYNSGSIKGKWMDLEHYATKDEFLAACRALHKDEADPEFMFQDYEGFPKALYNESYVSDELFEGVNLSEYDRDLLSMYIEATGDSEATIEAARDCFSGTADSFAEFAENFAEDLGEIPKDLPNWIVIDWEASWNCNLRHDFNTATDDEGTIWFFHNC